MTDYSVFTESSRIVKEVLLSDARLELPASFAEAAKKVKFVGGDSKPYILSPLKMTESSASLTALTATAANVIAAERYGIDYQEVEVNVDVATLYLESVLLPTVNNKLFLLDPQMGKELAKMDIHDNTRTIKRLASNIYQTKDGRWYHSHGSMNASSTMKMLGVPDEDVSSPEEAIRIYTEKIAQWDSKEIERVSNDDLRQAGVVCLSPDEFFSSEQGKIMEKEPLWSQTKLPAPRMVWPEHKENHQYKPMSGIKVLDFSRVIAAPAVSKILAALGADVLRVSCDRLPEFAATMPDLQTGKRDTNLDLKTPEGKEAFTELVKGAHLLVDGYRPGALGRLGFDSATLRKLNPGLIYMRENCYGFKGPLAHRSGWQQISDCVVGISYLQGKFHGLDEAVVPLFPNSDYQTGLVGATAALTALLARTKDDVTFDIDISLNQYNIWFYKLGLYSEQQQDTLRALDPEFKPRHFDDITTLVAKTHKSMVKIRPDIMTHPEYFWTMSGKEYGLEDDIKVLAPAYTFEKSKVEYTVPTGRRGRSEPKWLQ